MNITLYDLQNSAYEKNLHVDKLKGGQISKISCVIVSFFLPPLLLTHMHIFAIAIIALSPVSVKLISRSSTESYSSNLHYCDH
jgi:hypothetical protein